jgi:steroid delta-isomerase-like uncharacterized protein
MSNHSIEPLVRRWFQEVWNDRRTATIDELMHPDGVCHADQGELRGPAAFREQQFGPFVAAFPDLRVDVEEVLADGDQAVVRWTARGTHLGAELGFAPTGKPVTMAGMTWIKTRNGKFAEGWQSSNMFDVIRGLREAVG